MERGWDFLEEEEPSSIKGKLNDGGSIPIDVDGDTVFDSSDSDDDVDCALQLQALDMGDLKGFCKKASTEFFDQYGLVSHQINSYNDFVEHGIHRVFDSVGEIMIEPENDPLQGGDGEWKCASLRFGKVTLERPTFGKEYLSLLPRHSHLQNMTYSSRIKVETHLQVYKVKTGVDEDVEKTLLNEYHSDFIFGKLPVMVKSDLCWMSIHEERDCEFDQGGYFIIKGAEKTFIAQEQLCLKRLWVSKDPTWTIVYRHVPVRERVYVKLVPKVEHLRAGQKNINNKLLPKVEHLITEQKILTVYFYVVEVPVWLLFFALGAPNDREVVKLIYLDIETDPDPDIVDIFVASMYDTDKKFEGFRKEGQAAKHIKELMEKTCRFPPTESVEECIRKYLFPNLRNSGQKAYFLAYMVKCLLEAYSGRRKVDNRDDLRNKRVELAGELLERELIVHVKHAERRMVKAMQKDLSKDREVRTIDHYLDDTIITNGLSRAFSTGAWVHPFKRMERISGVVATLRRTNSLQTVSDMRRTRQLVSYTGRVGDARHPHPSHWGKVCFISTPDGENCGLVKNLAALGLVSPNINIVQLENLLKKFHECGMEKLVDDISPSSKHKVFLDGDWVGVCKDSSSFVAKLRRRRRRLEVPHQIEIKRDKHHGEVRIFADAGRILRPLLVVHNLKKTEELEENFSFQNLLDCGIVEFIGPEEEEDCQTAWGIDYLLTAELDRPLVKYTHCELDSSFLLGLSCGIIPFANHDHARRVLYQSGKHSQQAIGYSTTNPSIRVDTNFHQLYYPQRPLFRTMLSDCLGKSAYSDHHTGMIPRPDLFNGQCAIVAVNVHLGYNQEDSLVMNRASADRGMFRSEHVRSYKADVENSEADVKRLKADELISFGKVESKTARVDRLDDDGFPYIGAKIQTDDIVIGKHDALGKDHSIKLKHTERGVVQKVVLSANDEGKNFAVVSLRQVRTPSLGDKFSSMHGQKGVMGYLECQENFPFTKEGIVPDIVINPHAFPSRQTPAQLLESALGKGIALGGGLKYATPFTTPSVEDIGAQLRRLGFSRCGGERVYDGRTGERIESLIFMGPTFYQRLTHMAEDKVKFRNKGPVHPFTHQPVNDKKRFGGIKFGEMERDCLIAHGAAANLHERLFTLSDSSHMYVCRKCKNMVNVIQQPVLGGRMVRGPYCRVCDSAEDVVMTNVPYGAKILTQELLSMGISLKFDTELC